MCSTKVGRKPRNGRLGTESLALGERIGGLWGGSSASLRQELRTQVVTGHEHRATDHVLQCLEHEDRTPTMCLAHFSVLFCPFPGAVSASLSKHLSTRTSASGSQCKSGGGKARAVHSLLSILQPDRQYLIHMVPHHVPPGGPRGTPRRLKPDLWRLAIRWGMRALQSEVWTCSAF